MQSSRSVLPAGNKRMLMDFGAASLIEKSRQQLDKVGMALDRAKSDRLCRHHRGNAQQACSTVAHHGLL